MRQVVLVVALLTSLRPTPASGQQTPPPMADRVHLLHADQAGVPMVWEIQMERAKALPHWDLDTAPAPMSVEDATRIARTWLARRNPQVGPFLIEHVTLGRNVTNPFDPKGSFWHYTFFFIVPDKPGMPLLFYAVVLPDGSPVEPIPATAK